MEKHPLYRVGQAALECILKARPRIVVVENVMGWDKMAAIDDGASHMRKFSDRLSGQYWCRAVKLSLRPWVDAERHRVYLMAVHHDTAGASSLAEAFQIIKAGRHSDTAPHVASLRAGPRQAGCVASLAVHKLHRHRHITSHNQHTRSGHRYAPGEDAAVGCGGLHVPAGRAAVL